TLYAYCNDSAGNEAYKSVVFVIETPDPVITIVSPANATYTTSIIVISLTGNASHYWYYIADVDDTNHTWTSSVSRGDFEDSTYTIHAYGNDSAGNEVHTWVMFTIDATPPTVTIESPLNTTYSIPIVNITLSGDASHYWYSLVGPRGHGNISWTGSVQETSLADGTYHLHVYGNDSAGNVGHATAIFMIRRDSSVLTEIIVGVSGANNTFEVSTNITVNIGVLVPTTLTIKQTATGPEVPSTLISLGIYLNITLSDPSTLSELWINISFVKLSDGQDPTDVRIYYYDEAAQSWKLAQETGIDYANEIIWARMTHLTSFGVMAPVEEEPDIVGDEWDLTLIGAGALVLIIGTFLLFQYSALKGQIAKLRKRMREEDWQDRL
ncbi:MAG: hypothetical protein ACXAEI_20835, partial [Candidatus Hodarchaeales archaeon]